MLLPCNLVASCSALPHDSRRLGIRRNSSAIPAQQPHMASSSILSNSSFSTICASIRDNDGSSVSKRKDDLLLTLAGILRRGGQLGKMLCQNCIKGETRFRLAHELIVRALRIPGANVHWYDKSVIPQVAIIMGSDSDLPLMKDAAQILENFGVPFEVRIISAHRTPEGMYSFALSAKRRGIKVIIAGAGGAAHLPGMVASLTSLTVIGVPIRTPSLDGIDSFLSIVQMPTGVPVATVAIGNATNAGLLAVRMLAIGGTALWDSVMEYQEEMKDTVLTKAEKLEKDGWQKYLNPQVAIIMSTDSDLPVTKDAAQILENFGVSFEVTVISTHRTPERMYYFALSAERRGIKVIIAGAGGAAHLSGMVASLTSLPVIGVPIRTSSLDGVDLLLSILQMSEDIPVATVAIENAANAGLLAVRILAIRDTALWDRMIKYQEEMKDTILTKDKKLVEEEG